MLHLWSALLAVLVHSQAASCLVAAPAARVHRSVAPQLRHSVPIGIATMPAAEPIAPEDEWIAKVDIPAFKADMKALGDRLEKGQGDEDVAHLEKILRWSNICGGVGLLTCWMRPNPVSAPPAVASSIPASACTTAAANTAASLSHCHPDQRQHLNPDPNPDPHPDPYPGPNPNPDLNPDQHPLTLTLASTSPDHRHRHRPSLRRLHRCRRRHSNP